MFLLHLLLPLTGVIALGLMVLFSRQTRRSPFLPGMPRRTK